MELVVLYTLSFISKKIYLEVLTNFFHKPPQGKFKCCAAPKIVLNPKVKLLIIF